MQNPGARKARVRSTLVFAILVATLIFGCNPTQVNQNLSRTCFNAGPGSFCLEYKTWGQNVDSRINEQAVGYAYIIINNGLQMETKTFGKARHANDPPETAMTLDVRSNAASVTKTVTAVAALKLLAAKNVSVTSSISPYLPKGWTLGTGVSAITFAELLTHTSGIRDPSGLGNNYSGLKGIMGQNIGSKAASYQNANFALFRILITYLNGYNDTGKNDDDIKDATDNGYLDYMKSIYEPDIKISCKPGNNPVLSYPFPPGNTKGNGWGDETATCGGGGLQLSVTDMGVFMVRLMTGVYLPKISNNANEVTLPQMVSNMYGWDFTWPNTHGTCVTKAGYGGSGTPFVPWLSTLLVYCPDTGLAFVGMANSTLPSMPTNNYGRAGGLDDIVNQAYEASWQPGP
jgi:CubicO group peptidase (beta-lactamase class C family)